MRKHYSAEFKAKVALEAAKGAKTVSQIASEYEIHSARVSEWKSELLAKAAKLFQVNQNNDEEQFKEKEALLYQQIGQLTCELEWFKKKLGTYRLDKEEK